jgi:hypothetical protein
MTKYLVIQTLCPYCGKMISVTLTESQFEDAKKALERQKSLDLTKDIAERMRRTRNRGID